MAMTPRLGSAARTRQRVPGLPLPHARLAPAVPSPVSFTTPAPAAPTHWGRPRQCGMPAGHQTNLGCWEKKSLVFNHLLNFYLLWTRLRQ